MKNKNIRNTLYYFYLLLALYFSFGEGVSFATSGVTLFGNLIYLLLELGIFIIFAVLPGSVIAFIIGYFINKIYKNKEVIKLNWFKKYYWLYFLALIILFISGYVYGNSF